MTLFIDTLTDDKGAAYDYGHCYMDAEDGSEQGCGMEYAYYPEAGRLEYWHDAVGLVTIREGFTGDDVARLEEEHAEHTAELPMTCGSCGHRFADNTPSGRCPREGEHGETL